MHQIQIVGELGGIAHITLDPNSCSIDAFGDTTSCTEMAASTIEVKMAQLRLADIRGRRVFRLHGKLHPAGCEYSLVVPRRIGDPFRLVLDTGKGKRRVISLEPIPVRRPTGKPAAGKNVRYRAEQSSGKVMIHVEGEFPTAGWNVVFERLATEVFPPQFRLVGYRPTGKIAKVVTPLQAWSFFSADKLIERVVVHDAKGEHEIPVVQVDKKKR